MNLNNYLSLILLLQSLTVHGSQYRRSPVYLKRFDAKSLYFPCAPVSVSDEEQGITYVGQRCPRQVGLEIYSNIRYAVSSPLTRPDVSLFSYPEGAYIDTAFPTAFCDQVPNLPWNLTYEHMRDIEDRAGSNGPGQPIPEDCLTLSVIRPADLPHELSGLISPAALNSTHKNGLLPVTLIIDESGPSSSGKAQHNGKDEDDEDGDEKEAERVPNAGRARRRIEINAASIVARDMEQRGTGRIIVVANYVTLDKVRASSIFTVLKEGLEIMKSTGETDTADMCRTKDEFQKLSLEIRRRNADGPAPIEWPVYGSARGRNHSQILLRWIEENIEHFGGEPSWIQEVVVLPDGAMWRTTTEPDWQARRLVREEDLEAEAQGPEQKMIVNMPI